MRDVLRPHPTQVSVPYSSGVWLTGRGCGAVPRPSPRVSVPYSSGVWLTGLKQCPKNFEGVGFSPLFIGSLADSPHVGAGDWLALPWFQSPIHRESG